MNIYLGKNKKTAEKVSLFDVIVQNLRANGFKLDPCHLSDDSGSAIGIKLRDEKETKEITVNLSFTGLDLDNVTDIHVYESKIITIVDEENSKQII